MRGSAKCEEWPHICTYENEILPKRSSRLVAITDRHLIDISKSSGIEKTCDECVHNGAERVVRTRG